MEVSKEGIEALDAYLETKRNPDAMVKLKEVKPKNEKEKEGLTALDAYLEECRSRDQNRSQN